ncbi:amino acid adenylation domain-containing protein [Microbulbifer sp. OS29]|uniref:Amino acid adenylation domain-containing protein n=1 Tax=Microbulbifer okhotskensis TaxID=2926617 RepID=A0A9X2EU02_9GAMM|nr:amino acid adenylation domain-containing protein [Microbulbifer okhotskensis]MCO1335751.1 amino acid adenylation domain-containing protein [Microbulbifer okhotskensis]
MSSSINKPQAQSRDVVSVESDAVSTGGTVCDLIEIQKLKNPDQIVIVDGNQEINFTRLMQRVNVIAGELQSCGVLPGSLVGVCMNRSWELIAALLGVMRAGCAYVPLDPAYPQERVRYMLEHSRAQAAIVDTDHAANLCLGVSELLWIDELPEPAANSLTGIAGPSANDLAYVIYTSGSTGIPKGVAVEHSSLVALSQSMSELLSIEELDGVLAATSVCFDPSVMEIIGTLSLGGTVILAKNILAMPGIPSLEKVRTCITVPSAIQALLSVEKLPEGIRCFIFGGEVLKPSLVDQIYACEVKPRIINVYGPTEDTVYSTYIEITPERHEITIGRSVSYSRSYILDNAMQPVAPGEAGELYLAGNKLARGYLHDDALTRARFIEPAASGLITDRRLYKTGDLCRWTDSGDIEYLGRVDQQVKIRGFRIELEEIESILESMPGIDVAATTVIDSAVGQKMLVAYIVSGDKTVTEAAVKQFLGQRLPNYMIPQFVRHLQALPLLPNRKLDRNNLQRLGEGHFNSQVDNAATNDGVGRSGDELIESLIGSPTCEVGMISIIQGAVASLLNHLDPQTVLPELPLDEQGLDSLTTLELASRLSHYLKRTLSPQAIIDYPTPKLLASYILTMMSNKVASATSDQIASAAKDSLASFQSQLQASHPTFQAANAPAWSASDKSKLVQVVISMVNEQRRNPYSKVLSTGSGTRGTVTDVYNDDAQEAIIWTTNLYLGLNRDAEVIEQASTAVKRFGTGMGTSAAASGLTDLHLQFETEFADLVGKSGACLFPTGYTANVGVVAGLLGKDDVVVIDQLCHASIVDGARLCGAKIRTFKHNSASDLGTVLESEVSPYRTTLVVLEGVYSMGEGAAPVAEIVRTAKKYNALVLVDEAHSFGFYGEGGAGICAAQGITDQVDFIMTTLSKALGSLGGVVAAKREYVNLLKSSARAYIFQASVSPADIAAALTALRRLRFDDGLRERLWDTTRYMRQKFEQAGYDLGSGDGPIVTPHFGDKDTLFAIVQALYKRGIQTSAVTYPIVESGRGRLRFICSAAHTKEDVDRTLQALIEAERQVDSQQPVVKDEPLDIDQAITQVESWASAFSQYLRKYLARVSIERPNLALSVSISGQDEPIRILSYDGNVTLSDHTISGVPGCSMVFTNKESVSALRLSDAQGLLQSVCTGSCVLNGQIEPFIWFIARMVDWQKDSKIPTDSERRQEQAICL